MCAPQWTHGIFNPMVQPAWWTDLSTRWVDKLFLPVKHLTQTLDPLITFTARRGALHLLPRQGHRQWHIAVPLAATSVNSLSLFAYSHNADAPPPRSHPPPLPTSDSPPPCLMAAVAAESLPPPADTESYTAATSGSNKIPKASAAPLVEDISNAELKQQIDKYFKGNEGALSSIMETILRRKLTGKHKDMDDELMEGLRMQPLWDVNDREFEEDFDKLYFTDEEIPDLYNFRNYVEQKMVKDEYYYNMDERQWDEMVQEAVEKGFVKDMSECERILEDMLKWDSLLPDEIKQKVETRFNELGDL